MSGLDSMETLEYGPSPRFEKRHDRSGRECGLIDPRYLHLFEVTAPEQDELNLFDSLCDASDGGWVFFRDSMVRIDHFIEHDNEVRSVVEYHIDQTGNLAFVTTNLILHKEKYYLEIHPGFVDGNGEAWEPPVGSMEVTPAPHDAFVAHYRIAYDATPVRALPHAA